MFQPVTNSTTVLPTSIKNETHHVTTTIPDTGTIILRPLEAKFNYDQDVLNKMVPFCKVKFGGQTDRSMIATKTKVNHAWTDVLSFERKGNEGGKVTIKVKDKYQELLHQNIGVATISLEDLTPNTKLTKWYPLQKGSKAVGEILVSIEFQPHLVKMSR